MARRAKKISIGDVWVASLADSDLKFQFTIVGFQRKHRGARHWLACKSFVRSKDCDGWGAQCWWFDDRGRSVNADPNHFMLERKSRGKPTYPGDIHGLVQIRQD